MGFRDSCYCGLAEQKPGWIYSSRVWSSIFFLQTGEFLLLSTTLYSIKYLIYLIQ